MELDDKTFGGRLRIARKWVGLTRSKLAELSGVTQESIRLYEKNRTDPRLFAASCIADTLNVSLDWLTGREDKGWIDTHLENYITLQKNLKK